MVAGEECARRGIRDGPDVQILDKAAYVMLGQREFLLPPLGRRGRQGEINTMSPDGARDGGACSQVVNAGGISAFKSTGPRHRYRRARPASRG